MNNQYLRCVLSRIWLICLILFLVSCGKFSSTATQNTKISYADLQPPKSLRGISTKAYRLAYQAYDEAIQEGITKSPVFTIIDFSLPSTEKRLWTFNIATNKLYFYEYVSHGSGSGDVVAKKFSNIPESRQSSLGLYLTKKTYNGRRGLSLRLEGLEPGINDNASRRGIVMHGANYVTQAFVKEGGYAGKSWGCPAVNQNVAPKIISRIKGGSLMMMYYPKSSWIANSRFLNT